MTPTTVKPSEDTMTDTSTMPDDQRQRIIEAATLLQKRNLATMGTLSGCPAITSRSCSKSGEGNAIFYQRDAPWATFPRKTLGLSQEALAHEAGLHRTYVGSVERGECNISIDNIKAA